MIINIRGTSGSGKSTLVRMVRDLYAGPRIAFREPGRKQPIGYLHQRRDPSSGRSLGVVGHYESDCGGCDTISNMERIFELTLQAHAQGHDVIFEGLLISADVNRTVELFQAAGPENMTVIALTTPIEECLDSVNGRRRAKAERRRAEGKEVADRGDVNPKNTISKFKGVNQSCIRLGHAGVPTHHLGRVDAFNYIKSVLNIGMVCDAGQ